MENHGRSGNYGRGRGRGRGWGRSPYSGHHARGDEPSVVGSSSTNCGVYREKSTHQSLSTNHQKNLKPKQTQQWRPLSGVKDASLNAGNPQQERNPADDVGNVSKRSLESMASNSVSDKEHSSSCDQNVSEDLQSGVASLQLGEPIEEGGNGSNPLLYDHCNRFDAAKQLMDKNSSIQLMENNVSDCKESEDPKPSFKWRPLSGVKDASLNAGNPQQERNPADYVGNVSERSLESMASNPVSDKEHSSSCDQNVSEDLQSGVASLQLGEPIAEGGNGSNPLLYDHCNRFDAAKQLKDKNSSIQLMENNVSDCKESEDPKPSFKSVPFDICPSKETGVIKLNLPLFVKNREKRNEMKRAVEGNKEIVLRPGMVLLKGGISLEDQVTVVKMCKKLGVGSGGFYQPGYRDGGKLHLKMMCLGKNWDPETSKYGEIRSIDDTKPPSIPVEFDKLVEKAMEDSYAALVRKDSKTKNPEHLLPWMKPNICIVNFYSENGQLGLHQDRDESRESLVKGLPVVSFSIGDSAEFLFGDKSDPKEAEKVTLESGDILIFGGKSRHVFHGVTAIHPNTAPKALLEETNLRPGRLNLTFRQY